MLTQCRISKEGEVSGDGSFVLTKVIKEANCELSEVMSARENGMGREGGGNRRDSHPLWGGPA